MIEIRAANPSDIKTARTDVTSTLHKRVLQFLLSDGDENTDIVCDVSKGLTRAVSTGVVRTVNFGATVCSGSEVSVMENLDIGGSALPALMLKSPVTGLAQPARPERAHSFEVLLQDILAQVISRSSADTNVASPKSKTSIIREKNASLEQTHNRELAGCSPKKMSANTICRVVCHPYPFGGSSSLCTGLEHRADLKISNNKEASGPAENIQYTQHEQRTQGNLLQNSAPRLADNGVVRELIVSWIGGKNRSTMEPQGSGRVDTNPTACSLSDVPELIRRDVETNGFDTGLQDLAILNAAMIPGWPKPGTLITQVPNRKGGSSAQFEKTRDLFFSTILAYLVGLGVNSAFLAKAAVPGSRDRGRLLLLLLKLLGVAQQHDLPRQCARECRQRLKA